jgi:predicted lipoprotein
MYGHGGITETNKAVQKLFWWPDLIKDVTGHVKQSLLPGKDKLYTKACRSAAPSTYARTHVSSSTHGLYHATS